MSDIKDVIGMLCKLLNFTIASPLKPDDFRLAKHNKGSLETVKSFWITLERLTLFTLKERNHHLHIKDFGRYAKVKVYLAILKYPVPDFYSLPENDECSSRELLLALTWLISVPNNLHSMIQMKLTDGPLGKEFLPTDIDENIDEKLHLPRIQQQINNILHKSNKLSHNIKDVSELMATKASLMTKVHSASLNASGLPHLTTSEMAMTKRCSINKSISLEDRAWVADMRSTAMILDTYIKWLRKGYIFYDWLITVLDEQKKSTKLASSESLDEFAQFIILLHDTVKKKLCDMKDGSDQLLNSSLIRDCPSRLLRAPKTDIEATNWLEESKQQLDIAEGDVNVRRHQLENELNKLLESIPNTIQIN